jgi:hypothetical protein
MSKVTIAFSEKRLIEHLHLGGSLKDVVGGELLQRVISAAGSNPDVRAVVEAHGSNFEEVRQLYAGILKQLMPNPCIQSGSIMLAPTLLFMEPQRLKALFSYVEDDAPVGFPDRSRLLLERGVDLARHIQESHDKAYGPPSFTVTHAGGLGKSGRAGCASAIAIIIAIVGIGLAALLGEPASNNQYLDSCAQVKR